jgi:hypothetical protein
VYQTLMGRGNYGFLRTFANDQLVTAALGSAPARKLHTDIVEFPYSFWLKLFAFAPFSWCIVSLLNWRRVRSRSLGTTCLRRIPSS